MTIKIPIYSLKLSRDGTATFPAADFSSPKDAVPLFQRLIGSADREHVAALLLDRLHRPIAVTIVGIGALNTARIRPREVFRAALIAGAEEIVLAHNHPSGNPDPSPADVLATKSLLHVGEQIGIAIIDHLIVAPTGRFSSLRDRGLLTPFAA